MSLLKDRWYDVGYWWACLGLLGLSALLPLVLLVVLLGWLGGPPGDAIVILVVLAYLLALLAWVVGGGLLFTALTVDALINAVANLFNPEVSTLEELKRDLDRSKLLRRGLVDGLRRAGREIRKQYDRAMEPIRRIREWWRSAFG